MNYQKYLRFRQGQALERERNSTFVCLHFLVADASQRATLLRANALPAILETAKIKLIRMRDILP